MRDEAVNVAISMHGAIGKLHFMDAVMVVSGIFRIEKVLNGNAVRAIFMANQQISILTQIANIFCFDARAEAQDIPGGLDIGVIQF